jgi:hypothetical protein
MDKGDKVEPRKDKTGGKRNAAAIFQEGAKIEAKDHQGNKWWEAKVRL